MDKGNIYMIPSTLGDCKVEKVIPSYISDLVGKINYLIVENIRTSRRFLRKINKNIIIDNIEFFILDKQTHPEEILNFLKPAINGHDIGILSEAGCPGVADPGSDVIAEAHKIGIKVIPLSGPSSILMALMASGLNGQNFAFNGYLPIKNPERINKIKSLERKSLKEGQSQIFIETPYRNIQIFKDICQACLADTLLCIASDISLDSEDIRTLSINDWKKEEPVINKRPSIFIIQSS